jgi:antitoxin (DNA-binding transcriptional repressor) of toxin-antitoxin stability system
VASYRRSKHTVSATDAAKTFGRLVDRVREEQATYVVHRGGVPVARIGPAEARAATIRDLKALLSDRGRVADAYLRAVDAAVERHNPPRVRRNPWAR